MSNSEPHGYKDYFQKCLTGLVEEKNKVDACVNWLLMLNIAIMSVNFLTLTTDMKPVSRILLSELGILFTWMIMMRSCRAYRQLVNFGFIVKRLHDYERRPKDLHLERRLLVAIRFLDYPEKGTDPVYLTSRRTAFRINLTHEYGVIILMYSTLILYHLIKDPDVFGFFSILSLPLFLALIFFSMFYKKEGSSNSFLQAKEVRPKINMSIGLGDLHDRLAILKLKGEKLGVQIHAQRTEIEECISQYESIGIHAPVSDLSKIEVINANIWEFESQLRKEVKNQSNFDKIGRLAVKVRKLNAERVSIRNRINRDTSTGYEEPD